MTYTNFTLSTVCLLLLSFCGNVVNAFMPGGHRPVAPLPPMTLMPSSSSSAPRTIAFYKNLQEYEVDGSFDIDAPRTTSTSAPTSIPASTQAMNLSLASSNSIITEQDTSLLLDLPKSVFQKRKMNQDAKRLTILLSLEMIVGRTAIVAGIYLALEELLTGVSMTDQLHGMVDTMLLYL